MIVAPQPASTPPRLAPMPFAVAILIVYMLSFGSQLLLSPPTTGRFGIVPFVLVQIALIGAWIVLHRRRLRDAGRPSGLAIGIAAVYALEIVLFTFLIWLILSSAGTTNEGVGQDATILHLFVVLTFIGMLTGDPTLGALQVWIIGFVVLMLLPVVIGVIFSIWTATRPSAAAAP